LAQNDRDVSMQGHCVSGTIHLEDQVPRKFIRGRIVSGRPSPHTRDGESESWLVFSDMERKIPVSCLRDVSRLSREVLLTDNQTCLAPLVLTTNQKRLVHRFVD